MSLLCFNVVLFGVCVIGVVWWVRPCALVVVCFAYVLCAFVYDVDVWCVRSIMFVGVLVGLLCVVILVTRMSVLVWCVRSYMVCVFCLFSVACVLLRVCLAVVVVWCVSSSAYRCVCLCVCLVCCVCVVDACVVCVLLL